ncbi:FUSC family protein, partial [Pseudomonas aeruginosa]
MHRLEQQHRAAGQQVPLVVAPLRLDRDLQMALFYGTRSALALLGLSVYWIYTAWPAASGA